MWLLARLAGAIESFHDFRDAERWFVGPLTRELPSIASTLDEQVAAAALVALRSLSIDDSLRELLPYVLEPHGPGSRINVIKNPAARTARLAKKLSGVFYTPGDVADYMVRWALSVHHDPLALRMLDPSCGTGVYLLAYLRALQGIGATFVDLFDLAIQSVYGIDISSLAVETCTFLLLHQCQSTGATQRLAPWCAWHTLRLNLCSADALEFAQLSPTAAHHKISQAERRSVRSALLSNRFVPASSATDTPQALEKYGLFESASGCPLVDVFPEAVSGFNVLVGNPPYAQLGARPDLRWLASEYPSMGKPTSRANIYPLFIELMWRLTEPGHSSGALVLPLSIAFHQGTQYAACREAMAAQGGVWKCAFFDREPHALFGEEVKTRNAILLRQELVQDPPRGEPGRIETGPLRKWTSRTRARLFDAVEFTPVDVPHLERGIPRLRGVAQGSAFARLSTRSDLLALFGESIFACPTENATTASEHPRVFIGGTAYNFLNVFRGLPKDRTSSRWSESKVLCIQVSAEETADAVFAILSSRLIFWLWHASGDGFHVSRSFIERVPFGPSSFERNQWSKLGALGHRLWDLVQSDCIPSVNRGRRTVAFRPLRFGREREAIDSVLLGAAGISQSFLAELHEFTMSTVVVDHADHRRQRLLSYFAPAEGE